MPREREMSASIKDVSCNCADGDLGAEKGEFAVFENASHNCVSFGGDIHANPEKSQLSVEQVECEQQTTFGQLTHGDLARQTLLNSAPDTPKPPEPIGGGGS